MNRELRLTLIVLVLLVASGAVLYRYTYKKSLPSNKFSTDNVKITTTELGEGANVLPLAFPKGLPVEANHIIEHVTLEYPDRGMTMYSIVYSSGRQLEDLYAAYGSYFSKNKITVLNTTKTSTVMSYNVKIGDNDDLAIYIVPDVGRNLVKMALSDRK